MTPINPYFRGKCMKKMGHFLCTLWNHQFGAKYSPRGPPRAIYEPGGSGCRRDTYCIERVNTYNSHEKEVNVPHSIGFVTTGSTGSSYVVQWSPVSFCLLLHSASGTPVLLTHYNVNHKCPIKQVKVALMRPKGLWNQ